MQKLKDLEQAISGLDGDIAHLAFDPHDPQSIELAIQDFNIAIDKRLEGHARNEIVVNIAEQLKERGRNAILERAAAARLEQEDEQ
ncbi:MAG: hypothetical protein OXE84_04000 [Rhodobacteraceae bacterium]|nr:hypothetical protein [Paracoccaceae bacterium]MCY4196944.1 hypothetical protein [Paracoccaceae bacterium]